MREELLTLSSETVDRQTDRQASAHPQRVVDGVLLLVLRHHQGEGVAPSAAQPDLGQVVGAVDADTVDVGRGVGCVGGNGEEGRRGRGWSVEAGLFLNRDWLVADEHLTWVVDLLPLRLVDHQGDELLVLGKIILQEEETCWTKVM